MKNLLKGSLFATAFLLVTSSNTIANDYSGLNFSIAADGTLMNTWFHDPNGIQAGSTKRKFDYKNIVAGFSWSAGYDKKWDSVLPFGRDLYTGLEIGGTYLTDDTSSHHTGQADYVHETHYRGHHVISSGIELGFDLGQQKVSLDLGGALANILNIPWDYDSGHKDFDNSPHTQDIVPGFYVGMEIERLYTQNLGVKFGFRHYNFASMEEQWSNSFCCYKHPYKYENTLKQAEIGLVYYPQYWKSNNAIAYKPIKNKIKRDYSGLNFDIAADGTLMNTWFHDVGNITTGIGLGPAKKFDYKNIVAGFSWSAGYDKKWDSVLPFGRDLYTGLEIGGTYLTDDTSSHHIGRADYVNETHYRGHHVISSGIELGFDLGQQKVSLDLGGALANINNISWDNDSGGIDFINSPHTQDIVPGFYVGMEIERLYTQNLGIKFGFRHYNFASMQESWTDTSGAAVNMKYENTLQQAEIGLVYYLRQK